MFRYVVYDPDGKITQSNRCFDTTNFPNVLHEREVPFVHVPGSGEQVDVDRYYVRTKTKTLEKRPVIKARLNKQEVKAGGSDLAVISNLPKGCRLTIARNGIVNPQWTDIAIDDNTLELGLPEPGNYTVWIERFPYQTLRLEITAVE